jgi:predicted  nucleic acid-binding Zn-ribbon protein
LQLHRGINMKIKELKVVLKDMGLSTKGKKAELEARLAEAELVEEEEVVEEIVEEEAVEEEAVEEEAVEEVVVEEPTEEKEDVIEYIEGDKQGAYLLNGRYTIPKRPDVTYTDKYGEEQSGYKED